VLEFDDAEMSYLVKLLPAMRFSEPILEKHFDYDIFQRRWQ